MGCLAQEEQDQIIKEFWETQQITHKIFKRQLEWITKAAFEEEDPGRTTLLSWAQKNWVEVSWFGPVDSEGLYGTAYAVLPENLKWDADKGQIFDPITVPLNKELTDENIEEIEVSVLLHEERERTGSFCPDTQNRMTEILRRRNLKKKIMTADRLREINKEVIERYSISDPKDLPS